MAPPFYIEFLQGDQAGSTRSFTDDLLKVGRDEDCLLRFDEMGVSWQHAELRYRDGDFWVVDQGSTNGTYVNEERAHNARLKDGDVVRFGKKGPVVSFHLGSPAERPAKPKAPAGLPAVVPHPAPTGKEPAVVAPARLDGRSDLPPAAPKPVPAQGGGRAALAILFVGACVAAGAFYLRWSDSEAQLKDSRDRAAKAEGELRDLRRDMDQHLQRAREEGQRAAHELARRQVEQLEGDLQRERARAQEQLKEQADRTRELEQELGRTRAQLAAAARGGPAPSSLSPDWKRIERDLTRSVVLVAMTATAVDKEGKRRQLQTFGTGFFVSSEGHIATNKHVVQPWKFRGMAEDMAKDGVSLVDGSAQIHVWVAGSRFLGERGGEHTLDLSTGFSTVTGTLELVRTAPDTWNTISLDGESGPQKIRIHADNNDDIAILRVRPRNGETFRPMPLGRSERLEKLDEVLVLGFPAGPSILEAGVAETSPAKGVVRKVEQTIWVAVPMIGGNSGGPLVDKNGQVVGISTRVAGGHETLGCCLRVEHVTQLLNGGLW